MDKKKIKDFAVWARKKLIREITYKASLIGITEERIIEPNLVSRGIHVDVGMNEEQVLDSQTLKQRNSLIRRIEEKEKTSDYKTAFRYVIEEVAYTWFNRLIAIRFMEVNEYLPSQVRVLSSATAGKKEPDLVTNPFESDIEFKEQERVHIWKLKEENKLDELFRTLFIKQCNKLNEVLPELFEKTNDYTEYLLHISFVDEDGVVSHLVNDIEEDDFKEAVEIIGWMYQYYNTEPKDEVFALLKKNVKITKERLPAATQLFTPKWIVKYMVENSLGRLWLEGHPDYELKDNWKYYLDEAEQEEQVKQELEKIRQEYKLIVPEQIKIIDPCMGSGHILVYVFEVLLQIYESQGYTKRDAVASIVKYNLFGLDIDERAYQLSYFAIMMMATKYDRRFLTRSISPNVYTITESNEINPDLLQYFGTTSDQKDRVLAQQQIGYLLDTFIDAKEYGSILNVNECNWQLLEHFIENIKVYNQISIDDLDIESIQSDLKKIMRIGRLLASKFDVVVTNPPYMGLSGGNGKINEYARKHYPNSKSDMFAMFIEKCMQLTDKNKYMAMITQHSWMFLSSFEKLRVKLLENDIINMAHLGARAFEEIGGEVVQVTSWIQRRCSKKNYKAKYLRLINQENQLDKEKVYIENCSLHSKEIVHINGKTKFLQLPGVQLAYWTNERILKNFDKSMDYVLHCKTGLICGNNNLYIRKWFEITFDNIYFDCLSLESTSKIKAQFFPYNHGGEKKRWYGSHNDVVCIGDNARKLRQEKNSLLRNHVFYFKKGITWNRVGSGTKFAARIALQGFAFDDVSPSGFTEAENLYSIIGYMNTKVFNDYLKIFCTALKVEIGHIQKVPFVPNHIDINNIVIDNIDSSKNDWDSFETSWDFKKHPLI